MPADYTTECSDGLVLDLAEAFDLCGPTSVAVEVETILGDAIGNYTLIRTFTATDDAGNSTSASQTITVQDTTPPEFISVPEDAVVECSDDLPYSEPSSNDACGTVELTYSDEVIPGTLPETTGFAPSPPPTMPATAARPTNLQCGRHHGP